MPKKKRKTKKRTSGQVISQKVIVNIGKGYGSKRRSGTQAKRSVPPQVIYQQQPIPLQPDYGGRINDLSEIIQKHLSHSQKEEGRRRAIDLRVQQDVEEKEGEQGTFVPTERFVPESEAETEEKRKRGRPKKKEGDPTAPYTQRLSKKEIRAQARAEGREEGRAQLAEEYQQQYIRESALLAKRQDEANPEGFMDIGKVKDEPGYGLPVKKGGTNL